MESIISEFAAFHIKNEFITPDPVLLPLIQFQQGGCFFCKPVTVFVMEPMCGKRRLPPFTVCTIDRAYNCSTSAHKMYVVVSY